MARNNSRTAAPDASPPSTDAIAEQIHARSTALDRARANAKAKQASLEALIAKAISSKPGAPDWWAHPGPLTVDQVRALTNMTTQQIANLMSRYRTSRRRQAAKR